MKSLFSDCSVKMKKFFYFADFSNFPDECNKKHFRSIFKVGSYNYSYAVKECSNSGGRLMKIDNKSIENCVVQKDSKFKTGIYYYWNGLRRIGNGRYDFIWSDGKMLQQTDYPVWCKKTNSFQ